ncbi:MAG TPA: hypothetical protein VIV12_10865 [Streptosporangiaceae bacterium]
MIPSADIEVFREVPFEQLAYPSAEDIAEWSLGRGWHRDVSPMPLGDWEDAAWRLDRETELIGEIAAQADTPERFDDLAGDLECEVEGAEAAAPCDLGVASAVYTLCAAYCPTEVSCRGHPPDQSPWSTFLVVKFCADAPRARLVCEAAEAARCGLAYDSEEEYLELWASSITKMLAFSREMLARRAQFEALPVPDLPPEDDEEDF